MLTKPSRFVEVTDKEISEIKINSVSKNTKDLYKNTKTIIRLGSDSVIIGEYSPRLRLDSWRIFPDNHLAFGE